MKYAINSQGQVVEIEDNKSVTRFLSLEKRLQELRECANDLLQSLSEQGTDVNQKSFVYMVQPTYTAERLLYFAKTEFSSSSQAVKIANELNLHPEILADKQKTEFYQSIFAEGDAGNARWYFLSVGTIVIERNLCDCKKIDVNLLQTIPYAQFVNQLPHMLVTQDDMDSNKICHRYYLVTNGIRIKEPHSLLPLAFERDIKDGQYSDFDRKIFNSIQMYKKAKGFAYKDKTSNQATICLSVINENKRNVFPVYNQIKNCIKKNCGNAYGIIYHGNRVDATLNDTQKFTVYVGGTNENPEFIVGGYTYRTFEDFKQAFIDGTIFRETKWFAEKVKPHIQEVKRSPAPRVKTEKVYLRERKTRSDKGKKRKPYERKNEL